MTENIVWNLPTRKIDFPCIVDPPAEFKDQIKEISQATKGLIDGNPSGHSSIPEPVADFIRLHLEDAELRVEAILQDLAQANGSEPDAYFRRVVALVCECHDGELQIYIGTDQPNSNPPTSGLAGYAALSMMETCGRANKIKGVFVLDKRPWDPIQWPLEGIELQVLQPYTGKGTWIAQFHRNRVIPFNPLWQSDEMSRMIRKVRLKPENQVRDGWPYVKLEHQFDPFEGEMPDEAITELRTILAHVFNNSCSNGKQKPATKGHSAAITDGKVAYLGVNHKHPLAKTLVQCSERMAAAVAISNGMHRFPMVAVYSHHYHRIDGNGRGLPSLCDQCQVVMWDYAEKDDMPVLDLNDEKHRLRMLSEIEHGYSNAENGVKPGAV